MINHKFETLRAAICSITGNDSWEESVNEFIYVGEIPSGESLDHNGDLIWHTNHCLCGTRIEINMAICHTRTEKVVIVGSQCITHFMQANEELHARATLAVLMRGKRFCEVCRKLTKHPRACARCMPALRRLDEQAARTKKWENVCSFINMDSLNNVEREFVNVSVRWRIEHGQSLSGKQRAWLKRIIMQHPGDGPRQ